MRQTISFVAILIVSLACARVPQQDTNRAAVTVRQAYEMIEKDTTVVILDVRTAEEFKGETGHLKNAILIPVQELESRLKELEQYKDKTIIAVCRSGNRSGRATALLNQKGFSALNLEGGMLKWNAEGLPILKEKEEKLW